MELRRLYLTPSARSSFGVKLAPSRIDDEQAARGAARQVVVDEIKPDGPADLGERGLKPGDVVVGIGGQQVKWSTLQAVLGSAQAQAALGRGRVGLMPVGRTAVEWAVWRVCAAAGPGSPAWCWDEFARRLLRTARERQTQQLDQLRRESTWQPDDAPGSWIWCWRQFARALLSAARHSPAGVAAALTDTTAAMRSAAGSAAWCWELFARGALALDRRPSMRPQLQPPPRLQSRSGSLQYPMSPQSPSSPARPQSPDAALTERVAEIRRQARPDPPWRWLSGQPPQHPRAPPPLARPPQQPHTRPQVQPRQLGGPWPAALSAPALAPAPDAHGASYRMVMEHEMAAAFDQAEVAFVTSGGGERVRPPDSSGLRPDGSGHGYRGASTLASPLSMTMSRQELLSAQQMASLRARAQAVLDS